MIFSIESKNFCNITARLELGTGFMLRLYFYSFSNFFRQHMLWERRSIKYVEEWSFPAIFSCDDLSNLRRSRFNIFNAEMPSVWVDSKSLHKDRSWCGRESDFSSTALPVEKNKIFRVSLLNFSFSRVSESEVMSRKKQSWRIFLVV